MVTVEDFTHSLTAASPPAVAPALQALWYDARGDWHRAHEIAQDIDDSSGAWVHAYLHRKEGDDSNARYWYQRAGKPAASDPLNDEWQRIVSALIGS